MKTPQPKYELQAQFLQFVHPVKVYQNVKNPRLYKVTYGEQVKEDLSYSEAAHELGECLFHAYRIN